MMSQRGSASTVSRLLLIVLFACGVLGFFCHHHDHEFDEGACWICQAGAAWHPALSPCQVVWAEAPGLLPLESYRPPVPRMTPFAPGGRRAPPVSL